MAGVAERARRVRLAIFDVDGVLTDGTLYLGPEGEVFKAFDVQDGHGVRMLQAAGIAIAIISGRSSRVVERRALELDIAHVSQGVSDKLSEFERLTARLGIAPEECAFVGDDLPDLPVMQRCGFAVAVANAVEAVKAGAHHVTRAGGGRGAVREFCELILASRGAAIDSAANRRA